MARPTDNAVEPGECGRCRQARPVHSDRGASFYLCQRAASEARYTRYPRLPMAGCPGFDADDEV